MRSHRQKQISVPTVCDLTLWLPPPCVLHPHEASSLTRGTGAVSEQSFPSFTPLSPPLNRKHTYQCRVHLPVPACPLCRCLLKPGILLPCSPGSVNTAVGSQATGRLHAWTGWHTARSMTGGSTSLIICADIDSPSASGFSFWALNYDTFSPQNIFHSRWCVTYTLLFKSYILVYKTQSQSDNERVTILPTTSPYRQNISEAVNTWL